ncbi:YtxH domain-containing protein [Bernardetia sp. Wsw4-3y2]|uniref:YtxH domain-containing protein n=1 Tax=unclassified Bernardetia TaxID=2647129 RepID=UPI0030CA7527
MANSDNGGLGVVTFIAGLAVGALVGVLMAPEAGDKTRGRIARKSNDLLEELEGQVEITKHKVNQFNESMKERANTLAADAKAKANELADKAKNQIENAKGDSAEA